MNRRDVLPRLVELLRDHPFVCLPEGCDSERALQDMAADLLAAWPAEPATDGVGDIPLGHYPPAGGAA